MTFDLQVKNTVSYFFQKFVKNIVFELDLTQKRTQVDNSKQRRQTRRNYKVMIRSQ